MQKMKSKSTLKHDSIDSLQKNPRAKANLLSIATFFWTASIFYNGFKKDFNEADLTSALPEHSSARLFTKAEKGWLKEVERSKKAGRNPSFMRVVVKEFGPKFMIYALPIFFTNIVLRTTQPLLIGKLLHYFEPGTTMSKEEAYGYATGIAGCSILAVLLMHPYLLGVSHHGMKLRVATTNLIYEKALCITKRSRGKISSGRIINLMSNDVGKFDNCFLFLHVLWIGPLQTLVVTVLVWRELGPAAIFGIVAILIAIPLQVYLSNRASVYRLRTSYQTDDRLRVMNEIISGIQVIKMYSWEAPFDKLAALSRLREINEISKVSYIKGTLLSFNLFHSRIAIFFTVLAYVLMGNIVQSRQIFIVVALINTLRQTMTVNFPQSLIALAEAFVSINRVTKFLIDSESVAAEPTPGSQECYPTTVTHTKKTKSGMKPMIRQPSLKPHGRYVHIYGFNQNSEIKIEDATAKWDATSTDLALTNLSVDIKPKQVTAVIGPVGSGKTTLLHAILNELFLTSGTIYVSGSISYAPQEPWLFSGTVRDNILFGSDYDHERYRKVIRVCMLKTDLDILPYGDKTQVSERGTPLSGGQRARVNLARAVYKRSEIYLLDDPLSAVDTQVGKHLYQDCIQDFLRGKTVILVTHQVQYLEDVPQIILMNNGSIIAVGTYSELLSSGQEFLQALAREKEKLQRTRANTVDYEEESNNTRSESRLLSRRSSSIGSKASKFGPTGLEEMQTLGSVKLYVYGAYFRSMGNYFMISLLLFTFLISQGLGSGADYWLSYWINVENKYFKENYSYSLTSYDCTLIFCALSVSVIVVVLIRSFLFFRMAMRASMKLHNQLFHSVIRATLAFFSENNSGRIINRFSWDIGIVDEVLPLSLIDVMQISFSLIAVVVIVTIVNHWLLIATGFCLIIFYLIRCVYIRTGRCVKRVEGICRSPVYCLINSTLEGLVTIRAFQAEHEVTIKFRSALDRHSSAWFLFISTSRAYGYVLDIVCAFFITLVTYSFLVLDTGATSSDVGLALTQAVLFTGMFQWGMRQSAEVENAMTSVERILEYSRLESEANMESPPGKKPDQSWPSEGRISFENVYLRYGRTEPWVLRALTFNVEPREKVGIVGRTGAGKSSLIKSLFRMSEMSGKIVIDGIDVDQIGLNDLRPKISIIPQEPVLFARTMRKNLDLFEEYTDGMLWNALEQVELKNTIKALPQGLQTMISEGGMNMSVGQRQLVCLARALLRKNKILVLDEATANVDPQTDALIQKTIRGKFKDCTVLTIAHRLNTVMDSDKVLVMSAGSAVEYDHPYILLQNKDGFFYSFVHQAGKSNQKMLYDIAAEAYKNLEKDSSKSTKSNLMTGLSSQKLESVENQPDWTDVVRHIANGEFSREEININEQQVTIIERPSTTESADNTSERLTSGEQGSIHPEDKS